MKNFVVLLAVFSLLGNAAFAQQTGKGANAGSSAGTGGGMAVGVGLGALAVVGTVAGITAASASSTPASFSH